jgi:hypothetical protein
VELRVVGAAVFGRGSRASANLHLSDKTVMEFETLRDIAAPQRLAVEVAACTGAQPKLNTELALRVVALLRMIGEAHETFTADQMAFDAGASFLQVATPLEVDMADQGARWEAFSKLARHDPFALSREAGSGLAHSCIVLVGADGTRYVRSGWFCAYARREDPTVGGNATIAARMERVGWRRRASTGRIIARAPRREAALAWSFFEARPGWEDAP